MSDQGASYNVISEIARLRKENQQLREDKTELLAELYSLAFDEGVLKNGGALPKWTATLIQPMKGDAMEMAKQMWDAYAIQAGGKTFDGKPLPTWDELGEDRQSCWIAAASVAASRIEKLETALRVIVQVWDTDQPVSIAKAALARDAARKALEGKDD